MQRIIPRSSAQTEIVVENSRFIAAVGPVFDVDEARKFIDSVREAYPDASHHVSAFIIGHGAAVVMHCGDDGEPSGTAGRPALAVLQGSGFGDIAVVVARYFGGRKLGTGGLVRAYSSAVKKVLELTPKAEKVATTTLMTVIPYALFERVRLLAVECDGLIIDEAFAADVTMSVRLREEYEAMFTQRIIDLSRGEGKVIMVGKDKNTIMPL